MAEIIAALEEMFREKAEGRVEMPPKIGIHTMPDTMPDAFIHAMPASIPGRKAAGQQQARLALRHGTTHPQRS